TGVQTCALPIFERFELVTDLLHDELVELAARVVRVRAAAARLRITAARRLRARAAAEHEHVRRARVLRHLAEDDLTEIIHAGRGDGEELDAAVRRALH